MTESLSVPPLPTRPPRALAPGERQALYAVADVLIPGDDTMPNASAVEGFDALVDRALATRVDAFDQIVETASRVATGDVAANTRALAADEPDAFQLVSSVLAGAYLIAPAVRTAIGYPGQERKHPAFDEAAEEIMDGILDPVIERGSIYTPADV